jgi:hypothetical protein
MTSRAFLARERGHALFQADPTGIGSLRVAQAGETSHLARPARLLPLQTGVN